MFAKTRYGVSGYFVGLLTKFYLFGSPGEIHVLIVGLWAIVYKSDTSEELDNDNKNQGSQPGC